MEFVNEMLQIEILSSREKKNQNQLLIMNGANVKRSIPVDILSINFSSIVYQIINMLHQTIFACLQEKKNCFNFAWKKLALMNWNNKVTEFERICIKFNLRIPNQFAKVTKIYP